MRKKQVLVLYVGILALGRSQPEDATRQADSPTGAELLEGLNLARDIGPVPTFAAERSEARARLVSALQSESADAVAADLARAPCIDVLGNCGHTGVAWHHCVFWRRHRCPRPVLPRRAARGVGAAQLHIGGLRRRLDGQHAWAILGCARHCGGSQARFRVAPCVPRTSGQQCRGAGRASTTCVSTSLKFPFFSPGVAAGCCPCAVGRDVDVRAVGR